MPRGLSMPHGKGQIDAAIVKRNQALDRRRFDAAGRNVLRGLRLRPFLEITGVRQGRIGPAASPNISHPPRVPAVGNNEQPISAARLAF